MCRKIEATHMALHAVHGHVYHCSIHVLLQIKMFTAPFVASVLLYLVTVGQPQSLHCVQSEASDRGEEIISNCGSVAQFNDVSL